MYEQTKLYEIFKRKGLIIPYVNKRITDEGVTKEQKQELITGVTQLLVDVLGKNPATTVVTIDEIETDNWGIGGESVTVHRERGQQEYHYKNTFLHEMNCNPSKKLF